MITSWFIQRLLDWRTYAVLALIGIMLTIAHKVDEHGYNRGISYNQAIIDTLNKQIQADKDLYAQSLIDSSNQTRQWQAQTDKANEVAHNAEIKLKTITDTNHQLNVSLSALTKQANDKARMPATSKDAVIDYNATLGTLFNDCTAQYTELANEIDKHITYEKQLIDSYPK